MTNPYTALSESAFWKTAVADRNPLQIEGLWTPKFPIRPQNKIVTAGSCFAQHISRAFLKRGYDWFDAEPAPTDKLLPESVAREYNYGIFSFRTGNIYTTRMLRQWVEMAYDIRSECDEFWEKDGRYYDPLRPAIEPNGFISADEVIQSRKATLAAIRRAVEDTNVFVFTMGLTEAWYNSETDLEYAVCPGTVAGDFDPNIHKFANHDMFAVHKELQAALRLMRSKNPRLRVLLTVSPVPLTATASGHHVLTATSGSKAVLRAVAAHMAATVRFVDYFPSFEIITHPAFKGMWYAPNARSVVPEGVDFVMQSFFRDQERLFGDQNQSRNSDVGATRSNAIQRASSEDVKCEEELLNAFAQ